MSGDHRPRGFISRYVFSLDHRVIGLQYLINTGVLTQRSVRVLAVANLLVPSFYIGLNSGIISQPGLYDVILRYLGKL